MSRKSTEHSKYFWRKKYKELKAYARSKDIAFPYKSVREVQSDYLALKSDGVRDVTKEMKYSMKYQTSYRTALAERKALQALDIKAPKFKDLKMMSTTEFANKYDKILEADYKRLKAEGASGKEAAEFISNYWFGSE